MEVIQKAVIVSTTSKQSENGFLIPWESGIILPLTLADLV